jgi:hypothetical protein
MKEMAWVCTKYETNEKCINCRIFVGKLKGKEQLEGLSVMGG